MDASVELETTTGLTTPGVARKMSLEVLHLRRVNEALCERVEYMEKVQLGSAVRSHVRWYDWEGSDGGG